MSDSGQILETETALAGLLSVSGLKGGEGRHLTFHQVAVASMSRGHVRELKNALVTAAAAAAETGLRYEIGSAVMTDVFSCAIGAERWLCEVAGDNSGLVDWKLELFEQSKVSRV